MIKILIADDHAIVRAGLKQILLEDKRIEVIDEASDIDEVFQKLSQKKYNLLILDLNLPGKSGFESIKSLRTLYPNCPILILSMYDEEQYGIRCIREGASGYLNKASATEELINAINIVLSGKKYISAKLAENLLNTLTSDNEKDLIKRLSNRELEVLIRIAKGETVEEISKNMCLSQATIYTYRSRLMEKLNLKSNVEITQFAIRNKLINW